MSVKNGSKVVRNFGEKYFNSVSEKEIIEDTLTYFKYERDERPDDMGDPDWWEGNPPFKGMSDEEIRNVIKSIMSHDDFKNPSIQENFDTPMDLMWEIYCDGNSTTEEPKPDKIDPKEKIQQYIKDGNKGYLNLNNTSTTSLPDNFKVEEELDLRYTLITSLPDNLEVGGGLSLYGTAITSLPNNLKVGGNLNLTHTPISEKYTEKEIREMVPGVRGNIYL
jgi:hypothetical protein